MQSIGSQIKQLRQERDITQSELAKMIGCAQNTIAEWENKEDRLPGKKFLKDVARVLGISIDALMSPTQTTAPLIPCYGEIKSENFTWSSDITSYISVPTSEYGANRFCFKVIDGFLEPIVREGDYAIFVDDQLQNGDIVIIQSKKDNQATIRMWKQNEKEIALLGVNVYYPSKPYFLNSQSSKKNISIKGRLAAVKRIPKIVKSYPRINYIFS